MLETRRRKTSAKDWAKQVDRFSERARTYRLGSILLDLRKNPTTETKRQADLLYNKLGVVGYKQRKKRELLCQLLHTSKVAHYCEQVVRYSRNESGPYYSSILLQLIDKMVKLNYFTEQRSPPGSPKMSRLVPSTNLVEFMSVDPWTFDPPEQTQFVFLKDRETGRDLPFDPNLIEPRTIQNKLVEINRVNRESKIYYRKYDELEDRFGEERGLAPVHYALFTNDFQHHGRMYTGKYGHQSLRKIERATITFDGEPSVEFDYSGTHIRMLYHQAGIDYKNDPYALWGDKTTGSMRLMAKVLINALINAESKEAAVSACNRAMSTRTNEGNRKQGKALRDAQKLYDASIATKLKFKEIVPLAMKFHREVANEGFGEDKGVELMRIDSATALDILFYFARRHIPCLGCHDSFIVPASEKRRLRTAMERFYRKYLLFNPIIH